MDTSGLRQEIDRRLEPWADALGEDRVAYTNHVLRVVILCDRQAADLGFVASDREEYLTAGAFHDLGIWSAGTFDYLEPSEQLAREWLAGVGREDLGDLVTQMIDQHHKVRSAGRPHDPVEIFRRADAIDVEVGLLGRFGVSRAEYRQLAQEFPDAGFHRRLLELGGKRLRTHPLSPLPVLKW